MTPLFFQISYFLVPKIEICLKYLLDKQSPKGHSVRGMVW